MGKQMVRDASCAQRAGMIVHVSSAFSLFHRASDAVVAGELKTDWVDVAEVAKERRKRVRGPPRGAPAPAFAAAPGAPPLPPAAPLAAAADADEEAPAPDTPVGAEGGA
eukprot:3541710-Pyramimonas_sp.AAC.1